jgi:hypothetical protein
MAPRPACLAASGSKRGCGGCSRSPAPAWWRSTWPSATGPGASRRSPSTSGASTTGGWITCARCSAPSPGCGRHRGPLHALLLATDRQRGSAAENFNPSSALSSISGRHSWSPGWRVGLRGTGSTLCGRSRGRRRRPRSVVRSVPCLALRSTGRRSRQSVPGTRRAGRTGA